jgi:hypothetical protein
LPVVPEQLPQKKKNKKKNNNQNIASMSSASSSGQPREARVASEAGFRMLRV